MSIIKPKLKLKTPSEQPQQLQQPQQQQSTISFKEFIFNRIVELIPGDYNNKDNLCVLWSGYKQKHKKYDKACHIVYMKDGRKHFIDPQKYIFNYLNTSDINYGELIRMRNTVRNIDKCQHRGLCCTLSHLETST